jgi:hypothetical protein
VTAVTNFWVAVDNFIHSSVSWQVEAEVPTLEDSTGQITNIETVIQGSGQGSGSGDLLPPATQALAHLLTSTFLNGRQLRGRLNIPGLTENANDSNGTPTATVLTGLQTACDNFLADLSGPGPLRVFSKTKFTSAVVDSMPVADKWAVLRSRRD